MKDDLEKRIERQKLKRLPDEWREEILTAARDTAVEAHLRTEPKAGLFGGLIEWLSLLARPQRAGWATLAAVWVVIIGLNLAVRDDSPRGRVQHATAPQSERTLQVLEQQRQLFAELIGPTERREEPRRDSGPPGPRSQRREEMVMV